MLPDKIAELVLSHIRDLKTDLKQELKDLKGELKDEIKDVKEQLTGNGGVTERLTSVETKMEEWDNTPPSSYRVETVAKKSSREQRKDQIVTTATPAAIAGGVVAIIEAIKSLVQ